MERPAIEVNNCGIVGPRAAQSSRTTLRKSRLLTCGSWMQARTWSLCWSKIRALPFGWLFFCDSKRHQETREFKYAIRRECALLDNAKRRKGTHHGNCTSGRRVLEGIRRLRPRFVFGHAREIGRQNPVDSDLPHRFEKAGGHCVLDRVVLGRGIVDPVAPPPTHRRTRDSAHITAQGFLAVAGAFDRSV